MSDLAFILMVVVVGFVILVTMIWTLLPKSVNPVIPALVGGLCFLVSAFGSMMAAGWFR